MSTIVGNELKRIRTQKKLSQNQVCYGICAVSTYSRIEKGLYMPNLRQISAFFTRMGKSVPDNLIPITSREWKIYNIEDQLAMIPDLRDKRRHDLLKQFRQLFRECDFLDRQSYLMDYCLYISQYDERLEKARELRIEALRLTIPDFDPNKNDSEKLYSFIEIGLLIGISHSEFYINDIYKNHPEYKESAINRIKFLKTYMETHVVNYQDKLLYSIILFDYSCWVGLSGQFESAYALSCRGVMVTKKYPYYFFNHLYNRGFSLACMKKNKYAEKDLKKSLSLMSLDDPYNDTLSFIKEINTRFNLDIKIDTPSL